MRKSLGFLQCFAVVFSFLLLNHESWAIEKTKQFVFKKTYPNIKFFYGDGFEGLPTFAPFDKVIITAAAPFVPPKLLAQLKSGGRMVIPLDAGEHQRMLRITKQEDGSTVEEAFENFSFVPMLAGKNG